MNQRLFRLATSVLWLSLSALPFNSSVGGMSMAAQTTAPPSACAEPTPDNASEPVTFFCLGVKEHTRGVDLPSDHPDRERHLEGAAAYYRRAAASARQDPGLQAQALEKLADVYSTWELNHLVERVQVLQQIAQLRPTELLPLFRLAQAYEDIETFDAAELTWVSAKQLKPDDPEPYQMLGDFYRRRANAFGRGQSGVEGLTASQSSIPTPDASGVYSVGRGVRAPERLDDLALGSEPGGRRVDVAIVIDEQGAVIDGRAIPKVIHYSDGSTEQVTSMEQIHEAVQQVRRWRFTPTIINDRPVKVRHVVLVNVR